MDPEFAALIAGVIFCGGQGIGHMLRRKERKSDSTLQERRWSYLANRLNDIERKLDRDYVHREPHEKVHEIQDEILREHEARISAVESRIEKIEQVGR